MTERKIAMISSTAQDLPKHREEVRKACLRAGFEPLEMMEHLTAENRNAVETSLRMVEEADVFLGILAYRYGTVPRGYDISITEMEFNRALDLRKPMLFFFIHEDHPVVKKDVDTGAAAEKLQVLKDRIGEARVAAFFKSPDDIRSHVVEALTKLAKEFEAAETSAAATNTIDANLLRTADDCGLSSTAARYLPPEVTLIATSIDRKPQFGRLKEFLLDRLESPGRPSLIVLHGRAAELHQTFVRRCDSEMHAWLDELNERYLSFGKCDWPPNGSRLESVLRSLNEPFHLPRRAGRVDLEAKLRGLAHSVCFSHYVDASVWEPTTAQLIETWTKYCREDWPVLPPGRLVVAFLCIVLPGAESKPAKAARSYIEDLRQHLPSVRSVCVSN